MQNVIFLVHRIPFPPDKGDKIRSFHLLEGLSRHYRVHLGAFVDHDEDRRYQETVARFCASTCFVNLDPRFARCRSIFGLFCGEPLTVSYYRNRRLMRWIKQVMTKNNVQALIAFSGCMAQYCLPKSEPRRILDLVDIDSEKWNQYSQITQLPLRWLYQREYRLLRKYEVRLAREFDQTVLVSKAEADLLRRDMGGESSRVIEISNGVDACYFDPLFSYANPYPTHDAPVVIFTGAMNYRPNSEAISWFAVNVWPKIRIRCPAAQLWIVGSRPTASVRSLGGYAGVFVTGRVPDVRPYLRYAKVAVAPLQIARGLQNKILEALAMALPVVATPQAWEGIDPTLRPHEDITENDEVMATRISAYLDGKFCANGEGRRLVSERYDWTTVVSRFSQLVRSQHIDVRTTTIAGRSHG